MNKQVLTPQVITVLGATGSIGCSTLDVVARHPELFEVFALSGHRQTEQLAKQCAQFVPKYAVVLDDDAAQDLRSRLQQIQRPTQEPSITTEKGTIWFSFQLLDPFGLADNIR